METVISITTPATEPVERAINSVLRYARENSLYVDRLSINKGWFKPVMKEGFMTTHLVMVLRPMSDVIEVDDVPF